MRNDFIEIQSLISSLFKLLEIILEFIPWKDIKPPVVFLDFMVHIQSLSPSISRQINEIVSRIDSYFKNSLRSSPNFTIFDLSQNDLMKSEISVFLNYLNLIGDYSLLSKNHNPISDSIIISNTHKHRLIIQILMNLLVSSKIIFIDSTLTEIAKDNFFVETYGLISNSLLLSNGEILLDDFQLNYKRKCTSVDKVIVTSGKLTLPLFLFESFSSDIFAFNFLNSNHPQIIERELLILSDFLGVA
jgi:hypothetical protein